MLLMRLPSESPLDASPPPSPASGQPQPNIIQAPVVKISEVYVPASLVAPATSPSPALQEHLAAQQSPSIFSSAIAGVSTPSTDAADVHHNHHRLPERGHAPTPPLEPADSNILSSLAESEPITEEMAEPVGVSPAQTTTYPIPLLEAAPPEAPLQNWSAPLFYTVEVHSSAFGENIIK